MRNGFTLVELIVATLIILVVLTAFSVAITSFVRGGKTLELQDGALTLARVEIADFERRENIPDDGRTLRPDTLWGHRYTVETTVQSQGNNTVDVFVAVSSGDSVSIELSRRFYTDINTNRQELL